MYVLCIGFKPIAVAEREERLNEQMANYTAEEQASMTIAEVEMLT